MTKSIMASIVGLFFLVSFVRVDATPPHLDVIIDQFPEKHEAMKNKAIAEMTPYLESSLYRLKLICTEIRDSDLKTHCNYEYSKVEEQVDAYKTGKFDDIPNISLDEFAQMSSTLRANRGEDMNIGRWSRRFLFAALGISTFALAFGVARSHAICVDGYQRARWVEYRFMA